jgi:phage terminase small subunit
MLKLTLKQAKFAQGYLETGNATEAANLVYRVKNRNTAHAIGAENLRKPTIREYLDEKAENAAEMIYQLSQQADSEYVRLGASKDILDRAGYFVDKNKDHDPDRKMPIPMMFGDHKGDQEKLQRVLRMLQTIEGETYIEEFKQYSLSEQDKEKLNNLIMG